MYVSSLFAYCYLSVNVISFNLSQSDHIKWLTLHLYESFLDVVQTQNYLKLNLKIEQHKS